MKFTYQYNASVILYGMQYINYKNPYLMNLIIISLNSSVFSPGAWVNQHCLYIHFAVLAKELRNQLRRHPRAQLIPAGSLHLILPRPLDARRGGLCFDGSEVEGLWLRLRSYFRVVIGAEKNRWVC